MTGPVRIIHLCGVAQYRDEAERLLVAVGDAALVERGQPRSLVMKCPDGCGDTLVVNLDNRAGKAWRLDLRSGKTTLYPSVWREGGCGSHFIVWRDHILWCDRWEHDNVEPLYDARIEQRVFDALDDVAYRDVESLALDLDELHWDVSRAAHRLVVRGVAEAGKGKQGQCFRRLLPGKVG